MMAPLNWKSRAGSEFVEADVPPKPANENKPNSNSTSKALAIVPAFNFNEEDIPLRQWVIPGLLIRKHLSVLVAPPGAGKSLLTLQLGLAIARGDEWGGFKPRGSHRVLVVNSEDDIEEMRRRLSAAARTMEIDRSGLTDSFYLAENPESIVVAKTDPKTKSVSRLPLVDELIRIVTDQKIDALIVDPFAETFEGDENSNSEVKWAAAIWREVARKTNAAVLLVHHVSKALSAAPGDMNAARGGSALVGVARVVATLFSMSDQDANTMAVPIKEKHLYVRFDDAKANLSLVTGKARWFKKETVRLNNGNGYLNGDDVGVLIPWRAPPLMEGMTTEVANAILDALAAGYVNEDGEVTGALYSLKDTMRGKRWGGHIVIKHAPMDEARAGKILREWEKNSVIATVEFQDPEDRKKKKGIKVNEGNRPGREVI